MPPREPPQEVLVRAQEPEDLADVTELLSQPRAVWGTMQLPFTGREERRKRIESRQPNHTALVAVIEDKVIGSLGLIRYDNRRSHAASIGMAVHDAYAGRGAGAALMAAAVDLADNWLALRRLELNVWADNLRAIALYERFGFQREGLYRAYGFREGAYVDSVAMARLRE